MFFSVIVPVYKVEPYLRQCVDSILAQTYADFELILVDDGSPDACGAICDGYAQADSRVRVIHKQNGGLVSARQAGTEIAQGEYVVNIDSDDWIMPNMLESAHELLLTYNVDMISFGITYYRMGRRGDCRVAAAEPVAEGLYLRKDMERDILPKILMNKDGGHMLYYLCGKVFRHEKLRPFQMAVDREISLGEDVTCVTPYYLSCESVYISHSPMYCCRAREDSDSRSFRPVQYRQLALGVEALQNMDGSVLPDFQEQVLRYGCFSSFVLLVSAAHSGASDQLPQIRKALAEPVLHNAIESANFRKLTVKTRAAIHLMRRGRIAAAYRLLRLCEKIKNIL